MDLFLAAAEHEGFNAVPFIIAGVAAALFVTLGVVVHSYRDVAYRHSHKFSADTQNTSGHH